MKNKKAQAHVEMVLSFVIFAGFVLFLFFIFNPAQQTSNPKIVDFAINNIDDKVSVSLRSISIKFHNSPDTTTHNNCFKFDNANLIEDLGGDDFICSNENLIIKNNAGEQVFASFSGNDLLISHASDDMENTFTIYCAEGLENMGDSFSNCDDVENDLGIVVERRVWSASRLLALGGKYNFDRGYDDLRDEISGRDDFGISIFDVGATDSLYNFGDKIYLNVPSETPSGLTVYAKTLPVQVMKSDGTIVQLKARVSVW